MLFAQSEAGGQERHHCVLSTFCQLFNSALCQTVSSSRTLINPHPGYVQQLMQQDSSIVPKPVQRRCRVWSGSPCCLYNHPCPCRGVEKASEEVHLCALGDVRRSTMNALAAESACYSKGNELLLVRCSCLAVCPGFIAIEIYGNSIQIIEVGEILEVFYIDQLASVLGSKA